MSFYVALNQDATVDIKPVTVGSDEKSKDVVVLAPEPTPLEIIKNEKLSFEERLEAMQSFGADMLKEESVAVRSIMNHTSENSTLRNAAANSMVAYQKVSIMPDLLKAYDNEKESETWQDYSLQFMVSAYDFATQAERRQAIEALVEVSQRQEDSKAGTALLSLQRLAENHPKLNKVIGEQNLKALKSDDAIIKGAAVNVAIRQGDASILPKAREDAQNKGTEIRLRLSSIGAIGELGNAEDLTLLETLSQDQDKRVQRVARYQLQQLKRRIQ
ncbi:MAG: hypothetical protein MK193_02990 [Lentisphaeria bacterium]|nr:hypothetical protein [Lentisphaeria bacterium]